MVKSNGTQLLPAVVGVDYLAPGAGWKNITFANGFSAGNMSQPPALFIQGRTALLTGSILFPSVPANTSIVIGYLPTPFVPERIHYLSAYVLEDGPNVRVTLLTDGSLNLRTGSTPINSGFIAIINEDIILTE